MPNLDLHSDLLNYLANEDFQPGDRLPTISELKGAEHLNLSTSKIREQLEVARALGLVEVRSKAGMRLKPFSFTPAVRLSLMYAMATDMQFFEHFGALRVHLEVAFWNEACEQLTAEDLIAMRGHIEAARKQLNSDKWIQIPHQEHRAFHLTVFKRLDNPFVTGILEAYWDAYEAVELNRYADYDYHRNVWDYHERILDCICSGEYDTARALFLEHTRLLRVQPQMKHITENDYHITSED